MNGLDSDRDLPKNSELLTTKAEFSVLEICHFHADIADQTVVNK